MLKLTRAEMVDVLSAVLHEQDRITRHLPQMKRSAQLRMGAVLTNLQFVKEAINLELGDGE